MNKIVYYTNFNGVEVYSSEISSEIMELMEDEIVGHLQREYELGIVDEVHIKQVISDVIKGHLSPTIGMKICIDTHSR